MSDFFSEFQASSKEEWMQLVTKQLKGQTPEETLHKIHPIEEIEMKSYSFFGENKSDYISFQPKKTIDATSPNDWINNVFIQRDTPEKMNKKALHYLQNGATGLQFNGQGFSVDEIEKITKDIDFRFIATTFFYAEKTHFRWLQQLNLSKDFIITAVNVGNENFGFLQNMKNKIINAVDVQLTGGNVAQEIAYALHLGHQTFFELTNAGMNIEEAAQQIKFHFGIGSNFFFEISKFKVFKSLWNFLLNTYSTKINSTPYIEASTGFLNKSLKDPHTNLLRQTTEAIAAILGGVDELTILPYNLWSKNKKLENTQRLAINIALLLKEESYFDKVVSPTSGAFVMQELEEKLAQKSWGMFQELEKNGLADFSHDIQRVAKKRIELVENKTWTSIGINKFFNPENNEDEWEINTFTAFGKPLILEQACKIDA